MDNFSNKQNENLLKKKEQKSKNKYSLGNIESAEQLICDLYIDLRKKVRLWSEITFQTPQARMGYIGQHLTSVVTGYRGGMSGARGYDLIIDENNELYGEIKTCYRVDQLGQCADCLANVSSVQEKCLVCGSDKIIRKDDSKWLLTIKSDEDFINMLEPKYYYLVLFEFEDVSNYKNDNINLFIWRIDPKYKGFAYCVIDYYYNIRAKSKSAAPFNLWPYSLKFYLMKPTLIYQARIDGNDKIYTTRFPGRDEEKDELIPPLYQFKSARTLTKNSLINTLLSITESDNSIRRLTKDKLILLLDEKNTHNKEYNDTLCDLLVDNIYLPLLEEHLDSIPENYKTMFPNLN